jgi:hypothetical protein
MKQKGTSDVPLILGIIGTVLNIPAAMCGAACGAFITALEKSSDSGSNLGNFIVLISLIAGLSGLIGGILAKSNPTTGGVLLIIATVFSGLETLGGGGLLAFMVFILYLIGAIFAFIQKKIDV